MKLYYLLLFLFFSVSLSSQNKIGLEVRSSVNRTYNKGAFVSNYLISGFEGYNRYSVIKEENSNSLSYSIGLVWSFNQYNRLKFHFGRHRNGRIFDIREEDSGNIKEFNNFRTIYKYNQYLGSYTYVINKKEHRFPLELGIAINHTLDEGGYRWFQIEGLQFDLIARIGYEYKLSNSFSFGCNILLSHAINNYGIRDNMEVYQELDAIYIPYQIGLEFTIRYEISLMKIK